MHYLKCIAMLEYLLKKLCEGQRVLVPVGTLPEIHQSLVAVSQMLENDGQKGAIIRQAIQDILESVSVANQTTGLVYLTDNIKKILVDGIKSVRSDISVLAFSYFTTNDFEPTDEIIPIMRTVVSDALEKGVIQC